MTASSHSDRARRVRGVPRIILAAAAFAVIPAVVPGATLAHDVYRQPSAGRTIYDGSWSVTITTDVGSCASPYSVHVRIADGRVLPEGAAADVSGSVSRSGNVRVRVSSGGSNATGMGRLYSAYGRGRWSGWGSAGFCKGRWEARRSYS